MEFTDRGFAIYDTFLDVRGTQIRVQESSCAGTWATDRYVAGPFLWVFIDPDQKPTGAAIHLTEEQARRLHAAIGGWLDGFERERG